MYTTIYRCHRHSVSSLILNSMGIETDCELYWLCTCTSCIGNAHFVHFFASHHERIQFQMLTIYFVSLSACLYFILICTCITDLAYTFIGVVHNKISMYMHIYNAIGEITCSCKCRECRQNRNGHLEFALGRRNTNTRIQMARVGRKERDRASERDTCHPAISDTQFSIRIEF